ncbi:Subtilisin-like protease [Venturia inaequalis]|nr:Subtilisin-like protease [Venturia inaequalis]
MKLTTTLLLYLAVNSVTAKWRCEKQKGTPGVCRDHLDGEYGTTEPPQGCRKASPCTKPDHQCTPNQYKEPGTTINYANCAWSKGRKEGIPLSLGLLSQSFHSVWYAMYAISVITNTFNIFLPSFRNEFRTGHRMSRSIASPVWISLLVKKKVGINEMLPPPAQKEWWEE